MSTGKGTARYRYLRAPMGLASSGDEFCRRTDEALQGCEGVDKLVDDILVQAKSEEQLLERVREVLLRAHQHGVTLSKSKLQCGQEVRFGGFIIRANNDGQPTQLLPDPELLAAIRDFPEPTNYPQLKSFLGLLQ